MHHLVHDGDVVRRLEQLLVVVVVDARSTSGPALPLIRQRSELLKSRYDSAVPTVSLKESGDPVVRARTCPASVGAGSRPSGASTMSDVRRVLTALVSHSNQEDVVRPGLPPQAVVNPASRATVRDGRQRPESRSFAAPAVPPSPGCWRALAPRFRPPSSVKNAGRRTAPGVPAACGSCTPSPPDPAGPPSHTNAETVITAIRCRTRRASGRTRHRRGGRATVLATWP